MVVGLGRYGATTTWITVALLGGPMGAIRLLDRVRELDGLVRPGTFYGAIARLEGLAIIAPVTVDGSAGYRLVLWTRDPGSDGEIGSG